MLRVNIQDKKRDTIITAILLAVIFFLVIFSYKAGEMKANQQLVVQCNKHWIETGCQENINAIMTAKQTEEQWLSTT